jgi:phospholipase/lecithinase/hemolysin
LSCTPPDLARLIFVAWSAGFCLAKDPTVNSVTRRSQSGFHLACLLAWLFAASPAYAFDAIYAFGDSLTDTGNNPAVSSDYYQGRYSNGPLWIEYLSIQLGLVYQPTNNFAESGGETSNALAQVQRFVAPPNPSRSLFVVWAGGNDFIHNFGQGLNDTFWSNLVAQSVGNLSNAVSVLYADGARLVVVPNQVDLSRIPLVRDSGYPALVQTYLQGKVEHFNASLAVALTNLAQTRPDLQLVAPDVSAKFTDSLANLTAYGFTKADPDALDDIQLTDKSFTGPGKDYVFWDPIHPTTKAHALVAQWFEQALPPIPQPAQLSLLVQAGALQLTLGNLLNGQAYILQTSTNLEVWTDFTSINATNSVQQWSAPAGVSLREFFRLKK